MVTDTRFCSFNCRMEARLEEILAEIQDMKAAFPEDRRGGPDLVGHRAYHDARIAAVKAEEAFWSSLKFELAKKGAIALLTTIVGLIVVGTWATLKLKLGGK